MLYIDVDAVFVTKIIESFQYKWCIQNQFIESIWTNWDKSVDPTSL